MRRFFRCSVLFVLAALPLTSITLRAQGQVSFTQTPTYAIGNTNGQNPGGVVVAADFNGDGKPDIAVNNGAILLNNGDGTFHLGTNVGLQGAIAAGDFNGDGKQDLAVWTQAANISVLLGNGDGTFQSPINMAIGVPGYANTSFLAVALGNGQIDLVMPSGTGNGVWVFIGKGDGTFASPVTYQTGNSVYDIVVGDFNGDGKPDVATPSSNGVAVLLGNGDGTFKPVLNSSLSTVLSSLVVGDFNGDGKLDLAGATSSLTAVGVALGNGDGTLQNPG
jgi:hypothetical protein